MNAPTIADLFDCKPWNFERRLLQARRAPNQTPNEITFLLDTDRRYRQYHSRMFLSDKQRGYLQALAVRGGWRPSMDQDEPCYPFRIKEPANA